MSIRLVLCTRLCTRSYLSAAAAALLPLHISQRGKRVRIMCANVAPAGVYFLALMQNASRVRKRNVFVANPRQEAPGFFTGAIIFVTYEHGDLHISLNRNRGQVRGGRYSCEMDIHTIVGRRRAR